MTLANPQTHLYVKCYNEILISLINIKAQTKLEYLDASLYEIQKQTDLRFVPSQ